VGLSEAGVEEPVLIGGDGALAARLGLDHVASVAALIARLDAARAFRRGLCSTICRSRSEASWRPRMRMSNVGWASCRGSWAKRG